MVHVNERNLIEQGDDQRQEHDNIAVTSQHHQSFEAGDHITLACNAAGIPYNHHAIVISVSAENEAADEGERSLCVADFSTDGIGSVCVSSGLMISGSGSGTGNIGPLRDVHNAPLSSTKGEAEEGQSPKESRHGLRVICVSSANWSKITYASNAPTSPTFTIRRRIEFLLKHPHLIPAYSVIESNCECVAVWCKTGVWTTLQAQSWLGSTNFGSRMAIASLAVASSVVAIPFVGCMLAAGVMTEVASGVWGDRAKKRWEEQTKVLNEAFDKMYCQ